MTIKHKIDLRNGFLRSENLEIVVLRKVLPQIHVGAKPLQELKSLAAILDLLGTTCISRLQLWSTLNNVAHR